jgi:hypothetical protein
MWVIRPLPFENDIHDVRQLVTAVFMWIQHHIQHGPTTREHPDA